MTDRIAEIELSDCVRWVADDARRVLAELEPKNKGD